MNKAWILLLALVLPVAAANITTTTSAGLTTMVPGAVTIDFNLLAGTDPFSESGVTYTFEFTELVLSPVVPDEVGGEHIIGIPDTTPYLTVGSPRRPGAVSILLDTPTDYFGMYWGTPDDYNRIEFFSGATSLGTFTGAGAGSYTNFTADPGFMFDRIEMTSDGAAFETDNHAFGSAVPEPGTYAMLAAGLSALAFFRRKR